MKMEFSSSDEQGHGSLHLYITQTVFVVDENLSQAENENKNQNKCCLHLISL